MGLLSTVITVIITLFVMLVGTVAVAWVVDFGIEATVQDKHCQPPATFGSDPKSSTVTVKTKVLAITHVVTGMAYDTCLTVQGGNYVVYHLKSTRTSLYTSDGGTCVYDSVHGPAGCAT